MTGQRDTAALEKAVGDTVWPARLVAFTRWVGAGPRGARALTQTGRLTMKDARTLIDELKTSDVIDPVIGDTTFRTKSSEELGELNLALEWSRAAGLVRRQGNKLLTVKKREALLDRPLGLLERMVEVFGELGAAVCPAGWAQSILHDNFAVGVDLLFAATDAHPDVVDLTAVADRAWAALSPLYRLGHLTDLQLGTARRVLARDVRRAAYVLAQTGLFSVVATGDSDDERHNGVSLTELGRWAIRRARGGAVEGEPVLQVRVDLVDSADPQVWRRVQVPAAITLAELHDVLQLAMGWQNSHLHLFAAGGVRYGPREAELGLRAEDGARLGDVAAVGEVLEYLYDFGDGWEHLVTVEEAGVAPADTRYPRCVGGEGVCPPEDCGGIPGYEELRQALADPAHPDHDDLLDWLALPSPEAFDPARFDVRDADERLATTTRARSRRSS